MNWENTALVMIDLQRGVTSVDVKPNRSDEIIARTNQLIEQAQAQGGFLAYVHSDFLDDKDQLPGDKKLRALSNDEAHFADFDPRLTMANDAYVITKRGFSAFFGTDLDLELRRHHIKRVVFVGISTHVGIDSAARDAYQLGYELTFVTDAMAAPKVEQHEFALNTIFPMMGENKTTAEVLAD
ncbi:MAG: isochorismatase family protein [Aerococcus sp.]|nr:isochorismatase family protein [Aerococcus sp.]